MPPNKNSKAKRKPKSTLSQEDRRRKAAAQPLGGYGPPKGYNSRRSGDDRSYNKNQRLIKIFTIIMTIIMLVALLGSMLVGCIDNTSRAYAADETVSGVASPASTAPDFIRARYLKRAEALTPPTASLPAPNTPLPDGVVYVGETGHYVKGPIQKAWQARGGDKVLGYPLSEEFAVNSKVIQYFEKALLEYNPDQKGTKQEVQLGFLGQQLAEAKGLKFSPASDTTSGANRSFFKETSHSLSGAFKTYWEKNSGLEFLGFPTSEPFAETSGLTVQYFERGRLESSEASGVQVSFSGDLLLEARDWPRPSKLPLELNIGDNEIYQGRTLALRLTNNNLWEPSDIKAVFGSTPLKVTNLSGVFKIFVPVDPSTDVRAYPLDVNFNDPAGRARQINRSISVVKYDFPFQRLQIPEEKDTALDPAVQEAEEKTLQPIYDLYSPQALWSGKWGLPSANATEANVSTQFGERRAYNDSPVPTKYHGGVDYAIATGEPIVAPAAGKVVFADNLIVRGGCVIIDHGMGVVSYYFHMSQIIATKGQVVKPGDLLGKVGTTGLSSGPHLHWEVRVNGVITDPRLFQKQDLSR